jgi:hypothetical protein
LFISSYIIFKRIDTEKNYNIVELSVNYEDIVKNYSFFDALSEKKLNFYVDSIVFRPVKLSFFEKSGDLFVAKGSYINNIFKIQSILTPYILEILSYKNIKDDETYIYSENYELLKLIANTIKFHVRSASASISEKKYGFKYKKRTFYLLKTDMNYDKLRNIYFLDYKDIKKVRACGEFNIGLDITGISPKNSLFLLKNYDITPDFVISDDFDVKLNEYVLVKNIKKVNPEFENKIPFPYVKAHTLKKFSKKGNVVERFVRAVKERNVRFIKYDFSSGRNFDINLENIKQIRKKLKKIGFSFGNSVYLKIKNINYETYKKIKYFIIFSILIFIFSAFNKFYFIGEEYVFLFSGFSYFFIISAFDSEKACLLIAFISACLLPVFALNLIKIK